jgi:S-adenosylmethionine synthetase
VLETEKFLNSKDFKKRFPESGEDIKVMGLRKNHDYNLTIAMAFVDRFIDSENTYFKRKDEILEETKGFVKSKFGLKNISIGLNTLDQMGRGIGGMYLTVLGTSADDGDCGQVGRGNRVNGIIPLNRPTCSEAAAGKNPVSHVGKIYNLLTYRIADKIYQNVSGVREVYVWLLSQIGQPIDQPKVATAQLIMKKGKSLKKVSGEVRETIETELANIDKFTEELVNQSISVC